jgi:hypothetical protein
MGRAALNAEQENQGAGVHSTMKTFTRWLAIAVSLALAGTPALSAGTAARNPGQTTASSSSSAKKPSTKKKSRKKRQSTRMRLPKAPTPERISEIQTALAHGGYYQGDPNGKWDARTVAAVQKFQSANNLESTGKLDAPTLQKLGLGSDIAGVSAPKPVVPRYCCGAPPSSTSPSPSAPSAPAPSGNSAPTGHSSASPSQSSASN